MDAAVSLKGSAHKDTLKDAVHDSKLKSPRHKNDSLLEVWTVRAQGAPGAVPTPPNPDVQDVPMDTAGTSRKRTAEAGQERMKRIVECAT